MGATQGLILHCPEDWTSDQKGAFYESFVAELLKPMRFAVDTKIRFTGIEIDILAKALDQPKTILVECKAQRDPLSADVITKLIGNVAVRKADAGWLFSTSDLTKDGKGLWSEIQADPALHKTFSWFPPGKLISILESQGTTVSTQTLAHKLANFDVGDWTLIISPSIRVWFVQILEDGFPTRFTVFNATSGEVLNADAAKVIAGTYPRLESLEFLDVGKTDRAPAEKVHRAPIAKVISGDAWDDLRPARPEDFVGRDQLLSEIEAFISRVCEQTTQTRTFAILGPSGLGKSSLILKLTDLAGKKPLENCSITSVDTRSAATSSFISDAVRLAFEDAKKVKLISKKVAITVDTLRNPLASSGLTASLNELQTKKGCIVLIFDQFEELFSKEKLFDIFSAVRELSLDIDGLALPIVLGFAWKTDVSLPQQHPAYHLWHELENRRITLRIREFGTGDIRRVMSKSERQTKNKLSPALKIRLIEQCQGLPWLLKKLLVHVSRRISAQESQYLLLERELDVQLLFDEDLSSLSPEHIKCLEYVAVRAPIAVADVEENFDREIANHLINKHLLVRSGLNYVVYWDIFRDYLVEKKVPLIPWNRKFQRTPKIALKALNALEKGGAMTASELAPLLGLKEGPCFNLVCDLIGLQLIESETLGLYSPGKHLTNIEPMTVARCVQAQLKRHVAVRELSLRFQIDEPISGEDWDRLFVESHSQHSNFSQTTIHQYGRNLTSWLLFAGIIEQRGRFLIRPLQTGAQMGIVSEGNRRVGGKDGSCSTFLGSAGPSRVLEVLYRVFDSPGPLVRRSLETEVGFRNAIADALALKVIKVNSLGELTFILSVERSLLEVELAKAILSNDVIIILDRLDSEESDFLKAGAKLGTELGLKWKPSSILRNTRGLIKFLRWAKNITGLTQQAEIRLLP